MSSSLKTVRAHGQARPMPARCFSAYLGEAVSSSRWVPWVQWLMAGVLTTTSNEFLLHTLEWLSRKLRLGNSYTLLGA